NDRLVVLKRVHFGEVVVTDDLGKAIDESLGIVAAVHVLLRQVHRGPYLGHRTHLAKIADLGPVGRWLRVDALRYRLQQFLLRARRERGDRLPVRLWHGLDPLLSVAELRASMPP